MFHQLKGERAMEIQTVLERYDIKELELLGEDCHGFRYYMAPDLYVYQQYPATDYFVQGTNKKDCFNGWFCSGPAWDRTLNGYLVTK